MTRTLPAPAALRRDQWRAETGALWPLLALAAATAVAFWLSLRELAVYALEDSPLGFTPLVPPLALGLAVVLARRAQPWEGGHRVIAIDLAVAAMALAPALWLIAVRPDADAWYYWLNRMDLLALPLFALGGVALLWGFGGVLRLWPAVLLLLAVWPQPYFTMQQEFGGFLADRTADVVAGLNSVAGLPFDRLPGTNEFVGAAHGQDLDVEVAQVCSGLTSLVGFLTLALPLVVLMHGPWRARLAWTALGACLTLPLNVARLFGLFAGAAVVSPSFALGELHTALGTVLFVANVALMVALLPRFGLDLWRRAPAPAPAAPPPAAPLLSAAPPVAIFSTVAAVTLASTRPAHLPLAAHRALGDRRPPAEPSPQGPAPDADPGRFRWTLAARPWGPLALAGVVVLSVAFAVFNQQLSRLTWIGQGNGLPELVLSDVSAVLPPIEGWRLEYVDAIPRPDLFGADAESHIYAYTTDLPDGRDSTVVVQFIAVDDRDKLRAHTPQNCLLFHGSTVTDLRQINLGHGSRVALVRYIEGGLAGSMLFWTQPVNVEGERRHVRLVMFLDADEPAPLRVLGATDPLDNADVVLQELGRAMMDALVTPTPAADADAPA